MSDGVWLKQLRRGLPDAFEAIYREHGEAVYRYACAVAGNRADAEDLVQEAFLGLIRNADTMDERRALRPYLLRSVRNRHIDRWRSFVERGVPLPKHDPVSSEPSVSDRVEDEERAREIARLLEELPESQAEVVRLRIYGELDYDTIAAMTSTPRATVRNRYRSAIDRLGTLARWRKGDVGTRP